FSTKIDRIEARLVSVNGGNPIDWRIVVQSPVSGIYKSSLSTTGGWYRLEVRGIFNGVTVANAALEKVGIGEVFVICGQSNAAGVPLAGQEGASDDRVNCVANFSTSSSNLHPFPEFAQLAATTDIAPAGTGPWNWGVLGDLLVQRLGVPILFINTAFGGLDINAWVVSAAGEKGVNPFSYLTLSEGFPFNSLRNSIQQYTHMLGVRAILFHQGESDTYINVSKENYINRMQEVIKQVRQQTQKEMPFVLARVSRFRETLVYQPVIDAQNEVIAQDANVFAGPNTDGISDRFDNVHFSPSGLRLVAIAWNNSLSNDFFANSNPQAANEPLLPQSSCVSQNLAAPIILDLPTGLQNSRWSNGVIGSRVSTGAGSLVGRAPDAAGNTFFTPQIRYTSSPIPTKPLVTIDGPQTFCPGTAITRLNSSYSFNNIWNTTATTNGINVSTAGNFSVTHTNV
ncbi:MAG: sialate O-acetylesterase, partial [Spirosomaceae bacterium]|nr:sialate O-acetylesterase [Spirosomataceae bacterium]